MKKLTRKITLSLVAILFAVIALGTTTYAWFTLGTTATVSSINGEVKAAEGIEISLDKKEWVNSIDLADLTKAQYKGASITNTPVLTDLAMKKDSAEFVYTNQNAATANTDYLAFDLHVRVNGEFSDDNKQTARISNISLTSTTFEYIADVTTAGYLNQSGKYTIDASNAVRVTFAKVETRTETETETLLKTYGKPATNPERITVFNGGNDANESGHAYLYATAKNYDVKDIYNNYANYNHEAKDLTEPTDLKEYSSSTTDDITTYRVYIWLSGFDGDCINAILGKTITVNFTLSLGK